MEQGDADATFSLWFLCFIFPLHTKLERDDAIDQ